MKKGIYILFLISTLICSAQTTVYLSSNTSSTRSGQWTKIASVTLTSRYSNSNSTILLSGGNSSNSVTSSKLFFRVKQQNALSGAPYIQLELIQTNNSRLSSDDIKAITISIDNSESVVDLYIRISNSYEAIAFTPIYINNISPTFYSSQNFSTSLPSGNQTNCTYPNNYFSKGMFKNSVGIGTDATGSHKLAVEGSIGAREIKVEASGWSDFVFYKDYQLRPLKEIERFISKNKHLPDIPSESDVIKNGINLGEMDAKLLQKIEELTLYAIQQEKRLNSIELKNEQLEKEKKSLKNMNFKLHELQKRMEKLEKQ